jgi:hypothetical protein
MEFVIVPSSYRALRRSAGARPRARTTLEFASLHDHARLPARFFGRFSTADMLGRTI